MRDETGKSFYEASGRKDKRQMAKAAAEDVAKAPLHELLGESSRGVGAWGHPAPEVLGSMRSPGLWLCAIPWAVCAPLRLCAISHSVPAPPQRVVYNMSFQDSQYHPSQIHWSPSRSCSRLCV